MRTAPRLTTRPRLLVGGAAAALALALPGAGVAGAQTTGDTTTGDEACVEDAEGQGSAAGLPAECPDDFEPEVLGEVEVRPDEEAQPELLPLVEPISAENPDGDGTSAGPAVLTATGVDSEVLALGALGAIAVGGGALWASRRKKVDHS